MRDIVKSENEPQELLEISQCGSKSLGLAPRLHGMPWSILPQIVLEQHILLPDNGEVMVTLTKNNSIFPPINVLTQQNLNDTVNVVLWRNHLGLSPPWPRFLRLICSNGVIFARMTALRKVLGNGFVSSDRFWLCSTLCCQSTSLDRQNALDSLNWILVLKHHRQKKQSLALINGHFNPWSKYYILNLLFMKTNWIANMCVGLLVWW